MIEIRPAVTLDVPWVFAMCEDFARFYGSKISLAARPDYGKQFLENLVNNHVLIVAFKDGSPAGFIAGIRTPHHFNPDIIQLSELLWWVDEGFRNTGVGAKLFNEFITTGEAVADWMTFSLEHNSPIKDDFLLKRGFRLQERAYLKEIN